MGELIKIIMTKEQASNTVEKHFNSEIISVDSIENRGLVNQIYIVSTPTKKYVVRSDMDESDTKRFEKEKWCSEVALQAGVKTPKVFEVGMEDNHPFMIMEHIEGTNGDEFEDESVIWAKLGEYAKKIYGIEVKGYGEGMTEPGVFNDSWDRYLDYNIESLTESDKAIKIGAITKNQSVELKKQFLKLRKSPPRIGLVHYDMSLNNTIVTPDGEVYLLDWGSALAGPIPHLDISEILDSSLTEESDDFGLFLDGLGFTRDEYYEQKLEIEHINLLAHMDKLRWAMDRRTDRINFFSNKIRTILDSLI